MTYRVTVDGINDPRSHTPYPTSEEAMVAAIDLSGKARLVRVWDEDASYARPVRLYECEWAAAYDTPTHLAEGANLAERVLGQCQSLFEYMSAQIFLKDYDCTSPSPEHPDYSQFIGAVETVGMEYTPGDTFEYSGVELCFSERALEIATDIRVADGLEFNEHRLMGAEILMVYGGPRTWFSMEVAEDDINERAWSIVSAYGDVNATFAVTDKAQIDLLNECVNGHMAHNRERAPGLDRQAARHGRG